MKTKALSLALAMLCFSFYSNAQMNPVGVAPGLVYPFSKDVSAQEFPLKVNMEKLMDDDEKGVFTGVPYRIGYSVAIYTDLFELGKWIQMENGKSFFRAILTSPNAMAVNVAFEEFYLPPDAQLFFYNTEKTSVYGGYTHLDNHESRMFPGPLIEGDQVVIEYFDPNPKSHGEKPVLFVKDIMHYYRDVNETFKNQTIGASGDCQVNINCPEGDLWQNEKRGIARILLRVGSNAGWCTGTLINNTAQDGTPYFLTAEHCGSGASDADHNLWLFRFNFERPGCEDEGTPSSQSITGSKLIAVAEMDGGSDMRLLKLNFTPPASYQPYYNGWDRSSIPARSGVGIHHPSGDVKKISTFEAAATNVQTPLISGTVMASNSAWNVFYIATETSHGTTQGGSSGSPLFNERNLIVGSLTGGSSSCSSPNGANIYGKFNYHWVSNGTEPDRQLKQWLDPLGTGQLTLNGLDVYPVPGITKLEASVNNDYSVTINWEKPAHELQDNWFAHAASYSTVRHETPERAVLFNFKEILDVDTFYLKQISHLFWQHPNFPWGINNKFTFKIYDATTLIYESEVLSAVNFQSTFRPIIHILQDELVLTNPFYIAIAPLATGQPSSLASEIIDSTHTYIPKSYFGSPGNWQPFIVDKRYYELLINAYGSDQSSNSDDFDREPKAGEKGMVFPNNNASNLIRLGPDLLQEFTTVSKINSNGNLTTKSISNIQYYRIYRDGVLIGSTENAFTFSYIDSVGIIPGQTYTYAVSSVINLNPTNPNSPNIESVRSHEIDVRISAVNTFEPNEAGYKVFPNPNQGIFTVSLLQNNSNAQVKIIDIRGMLIQQKNISGHTNTVFDLSQLQAGIYFVVININNQNHVEKVIIY